LYKRDAEKGGRERGRKAKRKSIQCPFSHIAIILLIM